MASDQTKRKLAAVLAADIAGYSRLMGADEEGTLARLRLLRRELIDPKNKQHHGRIVKTSGDGILVEFLSVVDAIRCAIEIQQCNARGLAAGMLACCLKAPAQGSLISPGLEEGFTSAARKRSRGPHPCRAAMHLGPLTGRTAGWRCGQSDHGRSITQKSLRPDPVA